MVISKLLIKSLIIPPQMLELVSNHHLKSLLNLKEKFTTLQLYNCNRICRLTGLTAYKETLESLEISYNSQLLDFSELEKVCYSKLQNIKIQTDAVEEVDLSLQVNLKEICLKQSSISQISSLRNLKNLTDLSLAGNKLLSIEPLRDLCQLVNLDARSNYLFH